MAAKLELAWWRLRNIPEGTRFRDYAMQHITEQFGIFAGARINETTLSFEDSTDKLDIEGYQYYGGISFRFKK